MKIQEIAIAVDHEGLGPGAVDHFVAGDRGVRVKALLTRGGQQDIHHLARETGGNTELEAVGLHLLGHFGDTGQQGRVFRQALDLQRHEVGEHGVDVILGRVAALDLVPALANFRHFCQRLDVEILTQAHGAAGLLHGYFDALAFEHFDEDDGRRDDVGVGSRAAPIQDNALNLAPIGAVEIVI